MTVIQIKNNRYDDHIKCDPHGDGHTGATTPPPHLASHRRPLLPAPIGYRKHQHGTAASRGGRPRGRPAARDPTRSVGTVAGESAEAQCKKVRKVRKLTRNRIVDVPQ